MFKSKKNEIVDEPRLIKKERLSLSFVKNNFFVLFLGLLFLVGTSYSLTYFIQNKKIGDITMTVGGLTYTVTENRSIAINNLENVSDSEGLLGYSKEITIENTSDVDGKVTLTINRTSGVELEALKYGLYINGNLVEVGEVPSNGEIYTGALLADEELEIKVVLWLNNEYSTSTTTFVGSIEPMVKLAPISAVSHLSNLENLNNNYVEFNCDNGTCEKWRIKGIEDGRIVLTQTADLNTTFTNSELYNTSNSLTDDSLVVSMSTDNKAVYLKKTVKIISGDGTENNPYVLASDVDDIEDRKIVGYITYRNNNVNLTPTQPIYYGEDNYVSRVLNESFFYGWTDGTKTYKVGQIITVSSNVTLNSVKVYAENLSFDNTLTGFNCSDAQCAIETLNNLFS